MSPSGSLLFDKPEGWTSHDVVAVVRRRFPKGTKVGHSGTLDPLATGLLVLLVGQATKRQEAFQGLDKVYTGLIKLGVKTDTGDVTGKTLEERPVPALSPADVQKCMDGHKGVCEFPAPAYSAVKHQGKPLYKYARAGVEVPVKPRRCEVFSWALKGWDAPAVSHELHCSSGTYVRSLAESLGERLGCGGTVQTLRRERVGSFSVKDAVTMDWFKAASLEDVAAKLAP